MNNYNFFGNSSIRSFVSLNITQKCVVVSLIFFQIKNPSGHFPWAAQSKTYGCRHVITRYDCWCNCYVNYWVQNYNKQKTSLWTNNNTRITSLDSVSVKEQKKRRLVFRTPTFWNVWFLEAAALNMITTVYAEWKRKNWNEKKNSECWSSCKVLIRRWWFHWSNCFLFLFFLP
jgi:hypothetical protein